VLAQSPSKASLRFVQVSKPAEIQLENKSTSTNSEAEPSNEEHAGTSTETEQTTNEAEHEKELEIEVEKLKEELKAEEELAAEHEAEGELNVFQLGSNISVVEVCFAFLILVGATIVIEGIVDFIAEHDKEQEHWLAIIEKVHKELMILGVISFIFNCCKTSGALHGLSEEMIVSFEFSHNLLFLVGLSFALLSCIVCVIVIRSEVTWDNYEKTDLQSLVGHLHRTKTFCGRMFYGLTPMGNAVDFMLLKHIFIDMRKLPQSFDFQEYVQQTMLMNINAVLDVEMSSWFFLIVATFLMIAANQRYYHSDHPHPGPAAHSTVWKYMLIGYLMMVVEVVALLIIRVAVRRVVEKEGFNGHAEADKVILKLHAVKSFAASRARIEGAACADENQLAIETLKAAALQNAQKHESANENKGIVKAIEPLGDAIKTVVSTVHKGKDKDGKIHPQEVAKENEAGDIWAPDLNLSYAYPFKSPKVFEKFNDAFLLLKCLYLALFFNYFSSAALEQPYGGAGYFIGMLLPLLCSSLFITPWVYQYEAILTAVARVQPSVLGRIQENMKNQTEEMREKVAEELRQLLHGDPSKAAIEKLFKELDTDNSGALSPKEFQKGLAKLHIYYSPHKFKTLVSVVNRSSGGSGDMRYEQFVELLFPSEREKEKEKAIENGAEIYRIPAIQDLQRLTEGLRNTCKHKKDEEQLKKLNLLEGQFIEAILKIEKFKHSEGTIQVSDVESEKSPSPRVKIHPTK